MMLDGTVVDIMQGTAAALGAGVVSAFGWLTSKLFGAWRHEMREVKQVNASTTSALVTAMSQFQRHMERDEEIQTGMLAELKEMKGYLRAKAEA